MHRTNRNWKKAVLKLKLEKHSRLLLPVMIAVRARVELSTKSFS